MQWTWTHPLREPRVVPYPLNPKLRPLRPLRPSKALRPFLPSLLGALARSWGMENLFLNTIAPGCLRVQLEVKHFPAAGPGPLRGQLGGCHAVPGQCSAAGMCVLTLIPCRPPRNTLTTSASTSSSFWAWLPTVGFRIFGTCASCPMTIQARSTPRFLGRTQRANC